MTSEKEREAILAEIKKTPLPAFWANVGHHAEVLAHNVEFLLEEVRLLREERTTLVAELEKARVILEHSDCGVGDPGPCGNPEDCWRHQCEQEADRVDKLIEARDTAMSLRNAHHDRAMASEIREGELRYLLKKTSSFVDESWWPTLTKRIKKALKETT